MMIKVANVIETARVARFPSVIALVLFLSISVSQASKAWTPPVGIPIPSFGITNSHWMYTNAAYTYDFGQGPVTYPRTTNGPYTHYIDMNHAASTDSYNPFGTPSKPRKTVPGTLLAGSIVEIHGGPYNFINTQAKMFFKGFGTSNNPIFFRGVSTNEMPLFSGDITTYGTYLIFENMEFAATRISIRPDLAGTDIHHLTFRYLKMQGTGTETGGGAAISGIGLGDYTPDGPWTSNVVVYANQISGYGNWQSTVENDRGAVYVAAFNVSDVWVVDNELFHLGGDSFRVGMGRYTTETLSNYRTYVGRNHMYENHENAVDIKGGYDIVVSENVMHGFIRSSSDPGAAIAIHLGPTNVWVLNNTIYSARKGISCSDAGDVYVLSNAIYDVEDAINFWSYNEMHIIANTICRMNNGVLDVGASSNTRAIINNIFTGLKDSISGYHVKINANSVPVSTMRNNIVFENDGTFRAYWDKTYTSLPSFQSGTGQGQGCLLSAPQFVNESNNNFQLQSNSPARDAGASLSFYSNLFSSRFGGYINFDRARITRPKGTAWDIGSYEFNNGQPASPQGLHIVLE